jgi:hypothetical protein
VQQLSRKKTEITTMLYLVSEARVCCYLHVFFAVSKQQRKETLYIALRAEAEVFAEFSDQKLG